MPLLGTCHHCGESQPVFRKVAIANDQGVILDSAFFCENCWKQPRMRAAIEEIDLVDGK
jgi:hypothetical protein